MRKLRFYILAIAAVCAVACAEETKTPSDTPEFKTFEYELIDEGNYAFSISYEHITNTADREAFAIIEELNYLATFGEFAFEKQDLQRSAEALIAEALTNMETYDYEGVMCEMHIYQVATIIRNDSVVCYDTVIETNFGGVHPIVTHIYECYDIASGNAYDFSYLHDGEWYDALVAAIYEKLAAEYGDRIYVTSADYLHLPTVIYLTDGGIVFQYQNYEIADGSLGSIGIELSDAELKIVGAPLVWE